MADIVSGPPPSPYVYVKPDKQLIYATIPQDEVPKHNMPLLQMCVLGFIGSSVAGWVDLEILTKTLTIPSVHAKVCAAPHKHSNKPASLADHVRLQALWEDALVETCQILAADSHRHDRCSSGSARAVRAANRHS